MASQRTRKVGEQIREVVAAQLVDMKDPRIGFVTVTDVRVTPDLRHAEVFWTVLPDTDEQVASTTEGIASAQRLLRREVGATLRLRHVPTLELTYDQVQEHARHIEQLVREATDDGQERSRRGGDPAAGGGRADDAGAP